MHIHIYGYSFPDTLSLGKKKQSENNMRILEVLYGVHMVSKPE